LAPSHLLSNGWTIHRRHHPGRRLGGARSGARRRNWPRSSASSRP